MGMIRRRARRRLVVAGAATGAAAYHYGRKRGQGEGYEEGYGDQPDQGTAYAPPPTQEVAPQQSTADQIADLARLHDSGALTDEEFTAAKAKLIS